MELSRTLVETGREPGSRNSRPARLDRAEPGRAMLRQQRLADEQRLAEAAAGLARCDLDDTMLDDAHLAVLLRLLDLALAARTAGAVAGPGRRGGPRGAAAAHTLRPASRR